MTIIRVPARFSGFTLIELMITVSVIAVLLGIAVPSFQTMIINMSLASAANEVTAALQQARLEAIRRNRSVSVYLDTSRQWTVYVDTDGDKVYTSADNVTNTSSVNYPNPIKQGTYGDRVEALSSAVNVIYSGLGTGSAATVCLKVSGHTSSKKITLEASGRPMLESKETNCS